jgi:hypothetical protein
MAMRVAVVFNNDARDHAAAHAADFREILAGRAR